MDSPSRTRRSLSQPSTPSNHKLPAPNDPMSSLTTSQSNLFISPVKGSSASLAPDNQASGEGYHLPKKYPTTPTSRSNYGYLLKSPIKAHHNPYNRRTPGASPSTTSSLLSSPQYTPPRSGEYQDRFIPARTPRSAKIRLDFSDTDQGPLSFSPFQQNLNLIGKNGSLISANGPQNSHNTGINSSTDAAANPGSAGQISSGLLSGPNYPTSLPGGLAAHNLSMANNGNSNNHNFNTNSDPILRNRVISASTAPSSSLLASNITSNFSAGTTPPAGNIVRQLSISRPSTNQNNTSSNTNNNNQSSSSNIQIRNDRNLPTRRQPNSAQRPSVRPNINQNQVNLVDDQHFVASRLFRSSRRNMFASPGVGESNNGRSNAVSQVSNIVDQFNIKVGFCRMLAPCSGSNLKFSAIAKTSLSYPTKPRTTNLPIHHSQ